MKKQGATAADYALHAVCVWRLSDRANLAAKAQPDGPARLKAGSQLYRDTNKLREAADKYMNTSDPPS
ncbi:hypothetical protein JAB1_46570 [Janthinobacterium sp. MP5059B]|uniref:hypothetical protein n=1 Tax=Janthinobacterium sp. MP5059B TaxID=1766683 RepID=UPI000873CCD1|nr:hypothetical protein [Janthinobacterium sp. MP5059B]OEZ46719.1 hypothetical protein JAB1_46570 [Janthinobacterium sp. MP5059B]